MEQAGMLIWSDRFELMQGKIVPMNAKGAKHEHYKGSLNNFWMRHKTSAYQIIPETTFRLSADTYLEPDFLFYDAKFRVPEIAASNALLCVEISDTSIKKDMDVKAELYASFGVPALWVIDVNTLKTHVFGQVENGIYQSKSVFSSKQILVPNFAPELAITLAGLELI
jgi:Uma2 family endonuclease